MKNKKLSKREKNDQQIQDIIDCLSIELQEMRDHFMEQMETVEIYFHNLNKHLRLNKTEASDGMEEAE